MSRKNIGFKKGIACLLVTGLILTGGFYPNKCEGKTPSLNYRKITLTIGQKKQLKLNGSKKKAVWSILSGKKYISLKNRSNKSVVIKARKKGTAKVQAVVSGKKYVCTVKVN